MRIPSNSSPHSMFSLQRSFSGFLWKGLAHISQNATERRPRRVLKAAALFYLEPNKITAGKTETEIPHCLLSFSIIPPFEIIMVCLWTPAKQVPAHYLKSPGPTPSSSYQFIVIHMRNHAAFRIIVRAFFLFKKNPEEKKFLIIFIQCEWQEYYSYKHWNNHFISSWGSPIL